MAETDAADREPPAGQHYGLFDTALGTCGLAWSRNGITRLQLPHASPAATAARLSPGRSEAEPPPAVQAAVAELQRYLAGEPTDFAAVPLDLGGVGPFYRTVYAALRHVGWGHTLSYGDLAARAGAPGEARAIGQAMARNPVPVIIPCHRVVTSDGKLGGFSAYGGALTKETLLALEGVHVGSDTPRLPGL